MKTHSPKKTKPDPSLWEPMGAPESAACIDYLHAMVVDDEFEAACYYEYARESKILRDAAAELKKLRRKRFKFSRCEEVLHIIVERHHCSTWFAQPQWALIWQCPSFPNKSWTQLTKSQRAGIVWAFRPTDIPPLHMHEAPLLDSLGVFDEMKALSTEGKARRKQTIRDDLARLKVYPVIHVKQWTHALFTLDFGDIKGRMVERFEKWLELPENKKRFEKYTNSPRGKTGTFTDALKKLAEARLFKQMGYDGALKFTEANRRKDKFGKPIPFLNAKTAAPLWSEVQSAYKAQKRVLAYLAQFIPFEFRPRPQKEYANHVLNSLRGLRWLEDS